MRLLPLLALTGCASAHTLPCEFTVKVRVTETPDAECKALGVVDHNGIKITDDYEHDVARNTVKLPATVYGCAPEGRIISDSSTDTLGHELKHHVDRKCRKVK